MTAAAPSQPLAAVVLAAGASERMGRPKPLLPWGAASLIQHQVGVLATADLVDEIVVVTGHAGAQVADALQASAARIVPNPAYRRGRATSVSAGVRALTGDPIGIVIASADQPLTAAVVRTLCHAWQGDPDAIWRPSFKGRHGHPVVFPGGLRRELEAVRDATQGLRDVMRRHATQVRELPVADPIVTVNLNDPEAYAAARRTFAPDKE